MFNETLDLASYRKIFKEKGYVRIENVLEPAYAENIAATLKNDVKWDLCYLTGSAMTVIPQSEYAAYTREQSAELNREVLKKAQHEFSYFYYRSDLVRTENEVLSAFYRELTDEKSLGMFRYLTDEPLIKTVDGQLACFTPACFLKIHGDIAPRTRRLAAYVFSFTEGWVPDWGGHLHIIDEKGRNIDVFEPSFNTLTLFKVPTLHFVSQVSNYALGARLTTTGWMLY